MNITEATESQKSFWNAFVRAHYPPVGAFMQTWEWGDFQRALGRKINRYIVSEGGKPVALFLLVHHALPLGFSYGYAPRGPVIDQSFMGEEKLFKCIKEWARTNLSELVFVRFEPASVSLTEEALGLFSIPPYYVQPRFNHTVVLGGSTADVAKSFHPSTRSNLLRAERRGVHVEMKKEMAETDYDTFFEMIRDTTHRNSGTNAYPNKDYFRAFVKTIPPLEENYNPEDLSLGMFYGYEQGELSGMHFVLFFGSTATYLYGSSFTKSLRSKVATYLHWAGMREAIARGLTYYDLGGIDESKWPTLTTFKRQFRGKEFSYIGNIDLPQRRLAYELYTRLQKRRKV